MWLKSWMLKSSDVEVSSLTFSMKTLNLQHRRKTTHLENACFNLNFVTF